MAKKKGPHEVAAAQVRSVAARMQLLAKRADGFWTTEAAEADAYDLRDALNALADRIEGDYAPVGHDKAEVR